MQDYFRSQIVRNDIEQRTSVFSVDNRTKLHLTYVRQAVTILDWRMFLNYFYYKIIKILYFRLAAKYINISVILDII